MWASVIVQCKWNFHQYLERGVNYWYKNFVHVPYTSHSLIPEHHQQLNP